MRAPDFSGSYPYHVDDKGRTKLPAAFTAALGAEFVATRGLDGCIWLLPIASWQSLTGRLQAEGFGTREARRLQRFFIGSASLCGLDAQGRVTLPPVLRDYAAIQSEIIVAGIGAWVEIWARNRWDKETTSDDVIELDELLRATGLGRPA